MDVSVVNHDLGISNGSKMMPVSNSRRARLKGIDIQRKKKRETDSIYGDDESFEVFCTLVPNMVTVAAFALCVHALANKLTGRSVGSPAWYAVLAAAVATGTATWAIAAIYVYLYGRDLVNWAKRSGAKQQRRSEVSADSERQWLLSPEQKGYQ